ncbi:MAG: hypothetical protein ACPGN3_17440, partial [Opitutales bacterium]
MKYISLFFLSLWVGQVALGQSSQTQARVPVSLYAVSYQGQSGTPSVTITLNGETTTASGNGSESGLLETTLDVSATYTLSSTLSQSYYGKVFIESPGREWIVYVDGEPMNGPVYLYAGSLDFELSILPRRQLSAPAGQDSNLKLGSIHWEVSAGLLPSGKSAGNIYLKAENVSAGLHKPESFTFTNFYSSEVVLWRDTNDVIEYIQTPGNLVRIWYSTPNDKTYIDFHKAGEFTPGIAGGIAPDHTTGDYYMRYWITSPAAEEILIQQRLALNGQGSDTTAKQYHVRQDDDTWFYKTGFGGAYHRYEKRTYSTWVNNRRDETIEIGDGFDLSDSVTNVISKTKNEWERWKVGTDDEWSRVSFTWRDPDSGGKNYEDDYRYYVGGSDPDGVYGKIKSMRLSNGYSEKYDYFGDPGSGETDKRGLVRRIYSPSRNNDLSILSDANGSPGVGSFNGYITEYDYVGSDGSDTDDDFELSDLPTQRLRYLSNKLIGKSTYSHSLSSNHLNTTTKDYASNDANDYLVSGASFFRTNYSDEMIAGFPHYRSYPDNTSISYGYSWETSPDEFYALELSGTLDSGSVSAMNAERIEQVNWSGVSGNMNVKDLYMVPFQSTITVSIRDIRGFIDSIETFVFTGDSDSDRILESSEVQLISSVSYTYNDMGQVKTEKNDINGLEQTIAYDSSGRIQSRTDPAGLVTSYSNYNDLGVPQTLQQTGVQSSVYGSGATVDLITENVYDALGRLEYTLQDNGSETITQEFEYDEGGVLRKEILPCGKQIEYTPQKQGAYYRKMKVAELDDADTQVRYSVEKYYLDGSLENVTGDAAIHQYNTYQVTNPGQIIRYTDYGSSNKNGGHGTLTGRESITIFDWLGRPVGEYAKAMPSGMNGTDITYHDSNKWILSRYVYGASGTPQAGKLFQDLVYSVDKANFKNELEPTNSSGPSGAVQSRNRNIYTYNHLGQLLHQTFDLDNDSIADGTATDLDRITTYLSYAEEWNNQWFWIDAAYIWDENGSSAPVPVTSSFSMTRFSGFRPFLKSLFVYSLRILQM